MAITSARMQQKRGEEVNFDPDKMLPGEWAVSLDTKYVRMCFSPGVCVRMATYEAFEADMAKIQKILEECQTIEDAVKKIQEEINAKEVVVEKYVQDAKAYSETASDEADRATLEADRAKAEADRAQGIAGGDYVTHAEIVEYSLIKDTGSELGLSIDDSTYVMTVQLKNAKGTVLSEKTIDFPIEDFVNNNLTIAGIDLKDNITANELNQALGLNPLDSYEEITANTESGKFAGAKGVKEGFVQIDNRLAPNNTSLDCSISANVVHVRKVGNLVRIRHNGTITGTLTAATAVTLCTLPTGFRPKFTFTKNIMYRISSDKNLLGYGVLEVVTSDSQTNPGEVLLKPYNVPGAGGMLTFDETFIIT